VSGQGFRGLPPSSTRMLEGVPADSAALSRFSGRDPTPTGRFRGVFVRPDRFSSSGRAMLLLHTTIFRTSKIGQKSAKIRGLPPSSTRMLEGVPADSAALSRFPGGSRPLLADSGEKSCGPIDFHPQAGRCFCHIPIFSKRAKSVKNPQKSEKSKFGRCDTLWMSVGRLERACGELGALCGSNCSVSRVGELSFQLFRVIHTDGLGCISVIFER
jgi:hypothetical protein